MQIIKSVQLASCETLILVDTAAPDQPLQSGRPVHILRVVLVPGGMQYSGTRTRGAKVYSEHKYNTRSPAHTQRVNAEAQTAFDAYLESIRQELRDIADSVDADYAEDDMLADLAHDA